MRETLMKNKDRILFLLLVLFVSSVLLIYIEKVFYYTTVDMETSGVTVLESGTKYVQQMTFDEKIKLTDISVQFGTFARNNRGKLTVQFFEGGGAML